MALLVFGGYAYFDDSSPAKFHGAGIIGSGAPCMHDGGCAVALTRPKA